MSSPRRPVKPARAQRLPSDNSVKRLLERLAGASDGCRSVVNARLETALRAAPLLGARVGLISQRARKAAGGSTPYPYRASSRYTGSGSANGKGRAGCAYALGTEPQHRERQDRLQSEL